MTQPGKKSTLKIVLLVGCVVVLLCGGIPLCGGMAAVALISVEAYRSEAAFGGARALAESLRAAELARWARVGTYQACGGPAPMAFADGYNLDLADFPPVVPSCESIGDGAALAVGAGLVGAWWVEVSADGSDFTAHVLVDANKDGRLDASEEVVATAASGAARVLEPVSSSGGDLDFDLF